MKSFLSEYGFAILSTVVVILVIMMISPVGNFVKEALKGTVIKFSGSAENGLDNIHVFDLQNHNGKSEFDGTIYQRDLLFTPMGYVYITSSDSENTCYLASQFLSDVDEMIYDGVESMECAPTAMVVDSVSRGDVIFIMHNYLPGTEIVLEGIYNAQNGDLIFVDDGYYWVKLDGDSARLYNVYVDSSLSDENIVGSVNRSSYNTLGGDEISLIGYQSSDFRFIVHNWEPTNLENMYSLATGDSVYIKHLNTRFSVRCICDDKVILYIKPNVTASANGLLQEVSAVAIDYCSLTGVPLDAISYNYEEDIFEFDPTKYDIQIERLEGDTVNGRLSYDSYEDAYVYNDNIVDFDLKDGAIIAIEAHSHQ